MNKIFIIPACLIFLSQSATSSQNTEDTEHLRPVFSYTRHDVPNALFLYMSNGTTVEADKKEALRLLAHNVEDDAGFASMLGLTVGDDGGVTDTLDQLMSFHDE